MSNVQGSRFDIPKISTGGIFSHFFLLSSFFVNFVDPFFFFFFVELYHFGLIETLFFLYLFHGETSEIISLLVLPRSCFINKLIRFRGEFLPAYVELICKHVH